MTLPVTPQNVFDQYTQLRSDGSNAISYMKQLQQQITGGTVSPSFVLSVLAASVSLLALASQIQAGAPSGSNMGNALDAFVQQQSGQPTLDVHSALTTSVTALEAVVAAIMGDYPKSTDGHLLDRSFDASGNVVWASVAGSGFSATNTAVTAWLATVE